MSEQAESGSAATAQKRPILQKGEICCTPGVVVWRWPVIW